MDGCSSSIERAIGNRKLAQGIVQCVLTDVSVLHSNLLFLLLLVVVLKKKGILYLSPSLSDSVGVDASLWLVPLRPLGFVYFAHPCFPLKQNSGLFSGWLPPQKRRSRVERERIDATSAGSPFCC